MSVIVNLPPVVPPNTNGAASFSVSYIPYTGRAAQVKVVASNNFLLLVPGSITLPNVMPSQYRPTTITDVARTTLVSNFVNTLDIQIRIDPTGTIIFNEVSGTIPTGNIQMAGAVQFPISSL
jgi:hypothetical protein